jgi:hypothetical protein
MNKNKIIEMARQADIPIRNNWIEQELEAFAKLIEDAAFKRWAAQTKLAVQDEREACAKVCEQSDDDGEGPDCWDWRSKDYAAAIRERGEA